MIESNENPNATPVVINYDEPPTKPPPLLSTGALAWIRENLFSSVFDAVLTIVGILMIIFAVVSFFNWVVSSGDWFAITFNFEQYMYGRFDPDEVWRLGLFVLLVAFTAGTAIAAYFRRISPVFILILAAIYLPALLLPAIVNATIPLPESYMVAGNVEIVSGTVTEAPIDNIAFTAAAGEEIVFAYADDADDSDEDLATIAGFVDDPTNALRAAAVNRLTNIARFIELDELVQEDTELTDEGEFGLFIPPQRERIISEYESLQYTPSEADLARIDEIEDILDADETLQESMAADEEIVANMPPTPQLSLQDVETPTDYGQPRTITVNNYAGEGVLRIVLYRNYSEVTSTRISVDENGFAEVPLSEEDLAEPGYYVVYATIDDVPNTRMELTFPDGIAQPARLTEEEHEALIEERGTLLQPAAIVRTYSLNNDPVNITVMDRDGNPLPEGTQVLEPGGEPVTVTIPEDGWYILNKTIEGEEGVALLAVNGIYPLFERSTGFQRMTDGFEVNAAIPRDENNEEYLFQKLTENKYRGERPVGDYLRAYLSPFFTKTMFRVNGSGGISLQTGMLALLASGALGFFIARALDRNAPRSAPQMNSRRLSTQLLISIPFFMFLAIIGADLMALSMLAAWAAYVFLCYFIGVRLAPILNSLSVLAVGIVMILIGTVAIHFAPELIYGPNSTIPTLVATIFGTTVGSRLPLTFAVLLMLPTMIAVWYGSTQRTDLSTSGLNRRIAIAAGITIAFFVLPIIYANVADPNRFSRNDPINILIHTDPRRWGGLMLAAFITVYGILLAFPLGILLALGRRSELPAVKLISTLVIELVRGTPFIVVLFAGVLLIPFANPAFAEIPDIYSALAATIIFIAAYLAENVRGGLQSIPPGQDEAARALGLANWQIVLFITLPQALRAVIPALVGQFISLFKDTSLLAIVGLIDLTGVVNQTVVAQEFIGTRKENLLFITIIYFFISYIMSWVSRRIEASGSGSARRI
ncbi:amino acid ABC transporter permease [Phototrophicus methaneseepsis]|uniref:Amino acid ABC transporter permease n=1 Tax=Phototrophicus methaneseepsis TaxID=2710758 RepID=A0A7S8E8V9_9CHLR|nr:amino acid ABC transporter permease [Phototrophicus methaneseepsis]QPC82521.1 amino acid ABC transporter permease [Phototrophicus methaneseepsis]